MTLKSLIVVALDMKTGAVVRMGFLEKHVALHQLLNAVRRITKILWIWLAHSLNLAKHYVEGALSEKLAKKIRFLNFDF